MQIASWVWSLADVPAKDINLGTVSIWVELKANRPDGAPQGVRKGDR